MAGVGAHDAVVLAIVAPQVAGDGAEYLWIVVYAEQNGLGHTRYPSDPGRRRWQAPQSAAGP